MTTTIKIIGGLCLFSSLLGLFLMKWDKYQAKRGGWRVPEKTLFLVAIVLGSPGIWLGMFLFRHKTRHWYFQVGIPLIFFLQVVLLWWVGSRLPG